MTIIKNLAFIDKNRLKGLKAFVESELDLSVFQPFPVDLLHHLLPFQLKFLNETFVAIEDKKIKGLVTINKAGKKRVKITRLLLDENAGAAGKILVNCVVTTFLAKGAESFYVVINKMNSPLLNMFKEGCGFKNYAKEVIYKIKREDSTLGDDDINFEHIRKMKTSDVKEVKNLINDGILSFQKTTFYRNSYELKKNFIFGEKQYLIVDKEKGRILGYFTISKINKTDFLLDFVLASTYEGYIIDIIKFAKIYLLRNKNFGSLFVKLKSYYSNFGELNEILKIEYETVSENEILVKDFLVTKKQEFTYERMIFNDATPAF